MTEYCRFNVHAKQLFNRFSHKNSLNRRYSTGYFLCESTSFTHNSSVSLSAYTCFSLPFPTIGALPFFPFPPLLPSTPYMGKKDKKPSNFKDKGSAFSHSGVNLFAQFSNSELNNAFRYNPASTYSQQDFLDLKNLFQKCFKKSDHTKLKALGRILEVFHSKEEKSLFIDQLPNWVALFCRLMKFEQDKQVRMAILEVQRAFLRSFKKDFVLFISDIFVPMWNGQFDPSIEVSALAKEVFAETFPADRHSKVLSKCQEAYIADLKATLSSTELTISDEDLVVQVKQDMFDRLVSSSMLGLVAVLELNSRVEGKEAMLELVRDLVSDGVYTGPKLWLFLNPQLYRPKIRSAAVELLSAFLSYTPFLDIPLLRTILPLLTSRISDQDRFVSQSLWKVAMPILLDHKPPCMDLMEAKPLAKELINTVRAGGYGAGAYFYPCMLKLCSQLDLSLFSHTYIRELYTAFMQALSNDDCKTYSHALVMAYYEVFLLLYIKKQADREWLKQWSLVPVELYMKTSDSTHAIPSGFSRTLIYLDAKAVPFDIWDMLYQLVQDYLLKQLKPACVELLDLVSSKTLIASFSRKSQLEDLIENIFGVFSHDIEAHFASSKANSELIPALRLYQLFIQRLGQRLIYRPQLMTWWELMQRKWQTGDEEVRSLLSTLLQGYSEQWFEVVLALGDCTNPSYVKTLLALIPEKASDQLKSVCENVAFQGIATALAAELERNEEEEMIKRLSDVLYVLWEGGLLKDETRTEVETAMQGIVQSKAHDLEYIDMLAIIGCAKVLLTRYNAASVDILSHFIVFSLNKHEARLESLTESLWNLIAASPISSQIRSEVSSLFQASLHKHTGPALPSQLSIARHLLTLTDSPSQIIQTILLDESFFNRSDEEVFIWTIFEEMAVERAISLQELVYSPAGTLACPWLVADLQGVDFCPSLQLLFELRHRLTGYRDKHIPGLFSHMLQTRNTEDILKVLQAIISRAEGRLAYSKVLAGALKMVLQGVGEEGKGLTGEEAERVFEGLVEFVEGKKMEGALVEVIRQFKVPLFGTPIFTSHLSRWRAAASLSPHQLAIYGSALPEVLTSPDEADQALLSLPVSRGFHLFDFVYALAFSRRYGFDAFGELLPVYEEEALKVINAEDVDSLLAVLPFIQRLLGFPALITAKNVLSNSLISLTSRLVSHRSEQLMLDLAEVLARLYSIGDESMDEEGLYMILEQSYHEAVIKAVYHLLSYAYQNWTLVKVRRESEAGNPIPQAALRLLNRIPEVRSDSDMHLDPSTLAFLLGWLLLLSKYSSEQFHMAKREESPDSDFAVCLKTLLEDREELVTVFLTSLFAYFPQDLASPSLLKAELAIGLIDLFDEQACAELACFALYAFIRAFPALARSWWNHTEKRLSALVLKFITKVLSNRMFEAEIENIENRRVEWQCTDLEIRTSRAGRDITAHYAKEEVRVEIELRPPESYPLQPISLVIRTVVKLSEAKIRNWELRLNKLLNNENASILSAILMWKSNVDRELEGIEHCTICYYIVHVSDRSLPTMACKVCKNKFHASCIRKWFQTSNKNNCPLCQNHFWG